MYCDEDSSRYGHGSNFVGAIFMCNQTTKKECLRRKLFGLPMSHAGFVKKVKTGMFLFLFEHERRQLYGVFEATTDGAVNVVPGAYSKSGSSFPAQVHLKSLWICHPLSEDEFRDAICENYYAPYKFNFGLSFKQVAKLVELFNLKKISPRNRHSLDFHCNYVSDNDNSVTGRSRFLSVDATEQCAMNDMNSKSWLGVRHSMCNENPDLVLENPSIEHRSYPRVPSGLQPQLPNSTHSTSPIDHSREQSYFVGSKSPFHHIVPCFEGEQPSDVLGAGKPNFAQTLTETQALHPRNRSNPSYLDSEAYNFSATKYHKQDSFNELGIDVPNSTRRFTEIQVPPISSNSFLLEQDPGTFRSHPYPSQQVPATFSFPSTDNHGRVVSSLHDDYLPLQTERYFNFNYDLSTSKLYATSATDYLQSVHGLSSTHGYAETSKEVDSARGMQYWKVLPNNPNLPLVVGDLPSRIPSRYSSQPCDADVYGEEEDHYFSKGSSTSASSKLQLEMFQRRTSVFSRLSRAPKGFSSRDDVHNADKNSSLDLLKLLSRRTNQWKKMSKASKRTLPHLNEDDDKRLENVDSKEPVDAEWASVSAVVNEKSMELPFLNFKRRSGAKNVDDKTEGTCKRRKLIRPSFTENDPTDNGNKDTSAREASLGNREHVNPTDNVEGAETVVPTDTTDERILGSKENINDIPKAGANTQNVSVDSNARCLKASLENNDVSFDKISNVTHNAEGKEELTLAAGTKRDDSKPDENGEKNKISGRNLKHVSQASVISAEGAGMEGYSIFKSDLLYAGNKSTMLLDLNSEATYLESDANISNLDSDTMEEDHAGVGMIEHNISKSDLKFEGSKLDGLNETATVLLDLNSETTFLESYASVLNIDSATMEDYRASKSNENCAFIKSREDNEDGRLSDGNRENVSPIFDSAQVTVTNEAEEVARNSSSTVELKRAGNYSDLLI